MPQAPSHHNGSSPNMKNQLIKVNVNQAFETKDEEKRKKFFGDTIESIITGRLTNEYSHLCGIIERGEQIVEVPEMKNIAQLIISTIKRKDEEQYNALLNSQASKTPDWHSQGWLANPRPEG